MNVDEIRTRYPNPQVALTDITVPEGYCVGGALCLYVGNPPWFRFPRKAALAEVLREQNRCLTGLKSLQFARLIVAANDAGDFETAWHYLGEALTWKRNPMSKSKQEPVCV